MQTISLTDVDDLLTAVAKQDWKAVEAGFNNSAQLKYFHFRTNLANIEKPEVWVDKVEEIHCGGLLGTAVNGAVISGLCDLALGLLGLHLMTEGPAGTARLSIEYVRPLLASQVKAVASIEHETSRRVFGKVKVYNQAGVLCALAHGEIQRSRFKQKAGQE